MNSIFANNILLGVNIDHVATLRQARGTRYPDVVHAANIAEQAGADSITIHLREDRRHIQERDLAILTETVQTRINLEMAVTPAMITIAKNYQPADCCLVPEKREELTTEGGLDVAGQPDKIKAACKELADAGIKVSLFIDADPKQIEAASKSGAPAIEIHTGHYAAATMPADQNDEFKRITLAVEQATSLGLQVNAGHGLHYHNVQKIAAIPDIQELNIGHAIIARALFSGLDAAVRDMKVLMLSAR